MSAELDSMVVNAIALAMRARLLQASEEGKSGWQDKAQCDGAFLSHLFFKAVREQRLVDAMNYLMFLHHRQEPITLGECSIEPQGPEEGIQRLMNFYDARTLHTLIDKQEEHILRLQNRLRELEPPQSFGTQNVRAG